MELNSESKNSLESLRVSISEMPDDDLHKLIAEVRDSRKRSKKPLSKKKVAEKESSVKIKEMFASLSKEDKLALLAKMKGGEG